MYQNVLLSIEAETNHTNIGLSGFLFEPGISATMADLKRQFRKMLLVTSSRESGVGKTTDIGQNIPKQKQQLK